LLHPPTAPEHPPEVDVIVAVKADSECILLLNVAPELAPLLLHADGLSNSLYIVLSFVRLPSAQTVFEFNEV
jgi:hypothetical protein